MVSSASEAPFSRALGQHRQRLPLAGLVTNAPAPPRVGQEPSLIKVRMTIPVERQARLQQKLVLHIMYATPRTARPQGLGGPTGSCRVVVAVSDGSSRQRIRHGAWSSGGSCAAGRRAVSQGDAQANHADAQDQVQDVVSGVHRDELCGRLLADN